MYNTPNLQKVVNSFSVGLKALGRREGSVALTVVGTPQEALTAEVSLA